MGAGDSAKRDDVIENLWFLAFLYHLLEPWEHGLAGGKHDFLILEHIFAANEHHFLVGEHVFLADEDVFPGKEEVFLGNEDVFPANEHDFVAGEHHFLSDKHDLAANEHVFVFKNDMARKLQIVVLLANNVILTGHGQK
jgi:hypothetical protein